MNIAMNNNTTRGNKCTIYTYGIYIYLGGGRREGQSNLSFNRMCKFLINTIFSLDKIIPQGLNQIFVIKRAMIQNQIEKFLIFITST